MYWSIKVRHFDREGFPILTYQHNDGPEIEFDNSRLKPITIPTNIKSLGTQKVFS